MLPKLTESGERHDKQLVPGYWDSSVLYIEGCHVYLANIAKHLHKTCETAMCSEGLYGPCVNKNKIYASVFIRR